MESRASSYYQALLEADLITQIGNLFAFAMTLFLLWVLLRSAYLIATGKLQKIPIIGFKRRAWSFGRFIFPSYDPVISYKNFEGSEKQTTLKGTPLKNITAIDVFVFPQKVKFISLTDIGSYLFFGSLMSMIWLDLILGIDLSFQKVINCSILIMFILFWRSASQFDYANKSFLGLRNWRQMKRDKEITKIELEETEYLALIAPDRILTYEEAKRLESKEGNWKDILVMACLISFTGLMVWLGYSE